MQPNMTPDEIVETLRREDWREELTRLDKETSEKLLKAYNEIAPVIEKQANALVKAMGQAEEMNQAQVQQLNQYVDLLATVQTEMNSFSQILENVIVSGVDDAIEAGLNGASAMIGAQGAGSIWNKPAFDTVKNIIGIVDSVPFQNAISQFGNNAMQDIANLIITGVAQGKNPRIIGNLISDWYNVPYYWGQNMARTSMIYSARRSSQYAYQQNPRVVQWMMWSSAKDQRTCLSCWTLEGTIHKVDVTFGDHHQGRCTWIPLVEGRNWWHDYPLGKDRFEQLPEAEQRKIFNNKKLFDAWKNNEVSWDDFSKPYENDIYGTMMIQASYKSIKGIG